jgi:hypothetical protein
MSFLDYQPPPGKERQWLMIYGAAVAVLAIIGIWMFLAKPTVPVTQPKLSAPAATERASETH